MDLILTDPSRKSEPRRRTILLAGMLALLAGGTASAKSPTPRQLEFFESEIRPLLARHCYDCHSERAEKLKGGLKLDSRQGWETGGDSGRAIRPGHPERSLLIEAIRYQNPDLQMPPKHRLSDEEISRLEQWVRIGAPDPRDGSERQTEKATGGHWAFQAPRAPSIPEVSGDWPHSAIDRFILKAMRDRGLKPVADAQPRTVARRIYFDLIGLPPSPNQVEAFVSAAEKNQRRAVARLVDQLLASPRFGERWGRHWLDVARFAESSGHERNFTYPHAWRYRDYVIDSFNRDKPYDRFVREQIAGDLLPAEDHRQKVDQTMGTGFLAFGPKNHISGGTDQELNLADDQINATSKAILGLTIACARCHDHKYDPITTEEYYGLAGIFMSTESLHGTQPGKGGGSNRIPADLFPLDEDAESAKEAIEQHRKALNQKEAEFKKTQKALVKIPKKDRTPEQEERLRELRAKKKQLADAIEELKANPPAEPDYAMAVREKKKPEDVAVRIKGVPSNQGDVVPRGFPKVLTLGKPPVIDPESSGRLALANWLAGKDNPVTARVLVNRVWQHLFGEGIVRTVDNFGLLGADPTHPELLDHLALEFMADGWSIKNLIRRLMTSHVYQLASSHDAANYEKDPGANYLWRMRPRRLEAEPLRDAVLAFSGQLKLGPPEVGSVVAEMGDGCLERQLKTAPLSAPKPWRSVYLPVVRFYAPDLFKAFDGAPATLSLGRRDVTTVPGQTLFLLNNGFIVDQSQAAAERLIREVPDHPEKRIARAFQLAFSRQPGQREIDQGLRLVRNLTATHEPAGELTAWTAFCQALLNTAEFRYVY